ncbi:MAG: hypothetical protein FIA92_14840 [Chloroflexi bacterium]|nr:hypothetical protein [Chloroflexota bacterium]
MRGRVAPGRLVVARQALAAADLLRGEWRPGVVRPHAWVRMGDGPEELVWLDFITAPSGSRNGDDFSVASRLLAPNLAAHQVAHFELEQPLIRESAVEPAILRLTVGGFSARGADVRMQDLLRERIPAISREMTEAYVGRRIVGRAVEVTFISTWIRAAADRSLAEPLWPDIAVRYDTFYLGLYRPLTDTEEASATPG